MGNRFGFFGKAVRCCLYAAAFGITLATCVFGGAKAAGDVPNIVWIMAEDIGKQQSCYGHPAVQTPNIDGLAAAGVKYTEVFGTSSTCTPCRNAMLVGVYQTRTDTQDQRRRNIVLPEGMKPFTHLLQENGYHTANGCGVDYSDKTDHNFVTTSPLFDGGNWSAANSQPFLPRSR